jgi:phosphohistidine phosphatase
MLVGHEPTWSELAGRLIGGAALDFPTAALARIDLEIETWSRADFGKGLLVWLVTPRSLEPLAER